MEELLNRTKQNIFELLKLIYINENLAYKRLPDVVGAIEQIYAQLLSIFIQNPKENAEWINLINNNVDKIMNGMEYRDTIQLYDEFAYVTIPILNNVLSVFEG